MLYKAGRNDRVVSEGNYGHEDSCWTLMVGVRNTTNNG
jgi:hypothetical protein